MTPLRFATRFAIVGGFLIAELTGFSIGRYIVILPLALTAYVVSGTRRPVYVALSTAAAFGLWVLFSFVLFGIVFLEIGFLIEFLVCMGALVLSGFLRRQRLQS